MRGAFTLSPAAALPQTIAAGLAAAALAAAAAVVAIGFLGSKPTVTPFEEARIVMAEGSAMIVARSEITYALWSRCYADGGCQHLPKARRNAPLGDHPVTEVSFLDVGEFIAWLNAQTGLGYRLPTIEEWREIAGSDLSAKKPRLFDDPRLEWAADYAYTKRYSREVFASGHFGAKANGVADISGNVWEWTATCAVSGFEPDQCPAFVVAGDHEAEIPIFLRDVYGGGCAAGTPPTHIGFRLVRDE